MLSKRRCCDILPRRCHVAASIDGIRLVVRGAGYCRYADDGLVHCRTEQEAEAVRAELQARMEECHLQMHPTKTKIVYCRDARRRASYPNVKFDFLGYEFRPRRVRNPQNGRAFCGFTPAVGPSALKAMRETIRDLNTSGSRHSWRWRTSPTGSTRS